MHIKQVIISGFRSFRSQSEIESFSPKHNVIVGRNGSGKSNFFDAIQFVLLGPRFAGLRQEDRQHLLHEGLKKDEFFLNRKRVQKSEVMSLLESAGFSKSNPYYIVQQGKVSNLCVMKDKDRLNLLKEVAGTTVYEERRTESIKIMQETANKQAKVEELLSFIDERLGELEQEKKELSEYEKLDKQRRALEFNLYHNEFSVAQNQLEDIEAKRAEVRGDQDRFHVSLRDITEAMTKAEEQLDRQRQQLERHQSRREVFLSSINDLTTRKAAVEAELAESDVNSAANTKEVAQLRSQLEDVQAQIQAAEAELQRVIEPEFVAKTAAFEAMSQEFEGNHQRIEALYGKQGRGSKFQTRAQRDKFLQEQITSLSKQVTEKTRVLEKQQADIATEDSRLAKERSQIEAAEAQNGLSNAQYDEAVKAITELTKQRNALQEQKKSQWKDLDRNQEDIASRTQELDGAKQALSRALPRHISQGLAAVAQIAEELNLPKGAYMGPLVDNFDLRHEGFATAVEVAAGNNLFHIVVNNDTTAARLMKELERRKAGRLTFLPLAQLRNPVFQYPDSPDVAPLIDKAFDFGKEVEAAMVHVFGNKLLAKDLDVAARMSKTANMDCITRDGDMANRKGGMEGGYRDERASRLMSHRKIKVLEAALNRLREAEAALKSDSESAERRVNDLVNKLQTKEAERENLRSNAQQLSRELTSRANQITKSLQNLEERKKRVPSLVADIKSCNDQIASYTAEKESVLAFTDAERADLVALEARQRELQPQVDAAQAQILTVTARLEKKTADLENRLRRRRDTINESLSRHKGNSGVTDEAELEALKRSLQLESTHLDTLLEKEQAELADVTASLNATKSEVAKLAKALEQHAKDERGANEEIAKFAKMLDKILHKRNMLQETVSNKHRAIMDLGAIPAKEKEEFRNLSDDRLMKKLGEVNDQLKKYSSVNKKALDQYVSFNEQREGLVEKRDEMDKDNAAIQQLIEHLDLKKDEAILETFRNVSRHFSEVFRELVPNGVGSLVLKTNLDEAGEEDNVLDEDTSGRLSGKVAMSSFQGVQVSVSFSGSGQQYQMQQLSGGQKALVALAMIFAIQRCDPAPFYLFDEIDQALDASYRAGVARLIQKQVESEDAPAQFITTTFRPELVAVADKCYGIALMNKVSNIYPLEKTDAQKFVTDLLQQDETVGKVSSMQALSKSSLSQIDEERSDAGYADEQSPAKKGRPSGGRQQPAAAAAAAAKRGSKGSSKSSPKAAASGGRRSTRVSGASKSYKEDSEGEEEGEEADLADEFDEGDLIEFDDEEREAFEQLGIDEAEEEEEA